MIDDRITLKALQDIQQAIAQALYKHNLPVYDMSDLGENGYISFRWNGHTVDSSLEIRDRILSVAREILASHSYLKARFLGFVVFSLEISPVQFY
jgi:hypothetical protein